VGGPRDEAVVISEGKTRPGRYGERRARLAYRIISIA
jgi:hypothetical protein